MSLELDMYGAIDEDDKNNVYLFGSHQFALCYWAMALSQKKLSQDAQLIHIDYHPDFGDPNLKFPRLLSLDEIHSLILNRRIDNEAFIIPATLMGIVKDIAFCCSPNKRYRYGNFKNYISPITIVEYLDKYIQGEFLSSDIMELCRNIVSKNMILDIDMDYFLEPDHEHKFVSKRNDLIRKEVMAINKLFEFASITTIATTPQLGRKYQDSIKQIFSETFAVKIDFHKPMKIYPISQNYDKSERS